MAKQTKQQQIEDLKAKVAGLETQVTTVMAEGEKKLKTVTAENTGLKKEVASLKGQRNVVVGQRDEMQRELHNIAEWRDETLTRCRRLRGTLEFMMALGAATHGPLEMRKDVQELAPLVGKDAKSILETLENENIVGPAYDLGMKLGAALEKKEKEEKEAKKKALDAIRPALLMAALGLNRPKSGNGESEADLFEDLLGGLAGPDCDDPSCLTHGAAVRRRRMAAGV